MPAESELMECCPTADADCLPVGRDTHSSLYNARHMRSKRRKLPTERGRFADDFNARR